MTADDPLLPPMNVSDFDKTWGERQQSYQNKVMEECRKELPTILQDLRDHDIFGKVEIVFWGGGDEGQIDDIIAIDHPEKAIDSPLFDSISQFAEKLLEGVGVNWYDGEGGGGTLTIDADSPECHFDVYQNEIVQRTAAQGALS